MATMKTRVSNLHHIFNRTPFAAPSWWVEFAPIDHRRLAELKREHGANKLPSIQAQGSVGKAEKYLHAVFVEYAESWSMIDPQGKPVPCTPETRKFFAKNYPVLTCMIVGVAAEEANKASRNLS